MKPGLALKLEASQDLPLELNIQRVKSENTRALKSKAPSLNVIRGFSTLSRFPKQKSWFSPSYSITDTIERWSPSGLISVAQGTPRNVHRHFCLSQMGKEELLPALVGSCQGSC